MAIGSRRTERLMEVVLDRMLPAMMAVAPDPVIVVNEEGYITLANHHAYREFGWESGRLQGERLDALIPSRTQPKHKKLRTAYMKEPRTRTTHAMGNGGDLMARRFDGSEFKVAIGLTPIGPDAHPGSLVMAYVRAA